MKTLRELLLQRHQSVEPRLEEIRKQALAEIQKSGPASDMASVWQRPFRWSVLRFLGSLRWHLAGLSAAWLIIVILRFAPSALPTERLMVQQAPAPHQLLASLREHCRQLRELTAPVEAQPPAAPRRRGELQSSTALA
jgi:hypothetical protein